MPQSREFLFEEIIDPVTEMWAAADDAIIDVPDTESRCPVRISDAKHSVQFELRKVSFAVGFGHLSGLLLFMQNMVSENQHIHIRHQKTVPGVFW